MQLNGGSNQAAVSAAQRQTSQEKYVSNNNTRPQPAKQQTYVIDEDDNGGLQQNSPGAGIDQQSVFEDGVPATNSAGYEAQLEYQKQQQALSLQQQKEELKIGRAHV